MSNRKQRARKRAKKLGISYQQALNMYRDPPQKEGNEECDQEYEEYERYIEQKTRRILTEDERERKAIIARREAKEVQIMDVPHTIKWDF